VVDDVGWEDGTGTWAGWSEVAPISKRSPSLEQLHALISPMAAVEENQSVLMHNWNWEDAVMP